MSRRRKRRRWRTTWTSHSCVAAKKRSRFVNNIKFKLFIVPDLKIDPGSLSFYKHCLSLDPDL